MCPGRIDRSGTEMMKCMHDMPGDTDHTQSGYVFHYVPSVAAVAFLLRINCYFGSATAPNLGRNSPELSSGISD